MRRIWAVWLLVWLAAPAWGGLVALDSEGMVASAEENATEAGASVLRAGGNAVDAAVAVAFALAVTHPIAGNLGGGGFMLIRLADGRTTAIDFREVAPLAATRGMFLETQDGSTVGGLAAGIPGTVAGLALALEKYGTRPMRELIAPALALASEGHPLDEWHATQLAEQLPKMLPFPASAAIFSKAGLPYQAGEILRQPELAHTLWTLAELGPRAFYEGPLAHRLVEGARAAGAIWTEQDLAQYQAVERTPLRFDYRGFTILTMPPPSSGGIVLAQMLLAAEKLKLYEQTPGSPQEYHLYAEIARRMYADRNQWLGDPDFVKIPLAGLLDPDYLAQRLAGIDPDHATPSAEVGPGTPPGSEQTTHFCVVDRWGNAVSLTTTLNLEFGSKAVAADTGVLLNNEMDDFMTKPGAPNSFGLVQGERNSVQPRKRMLSSMTPVIVLQGERLLLLTGARGGSTIITTVFNILRHVLDQGSSLEAAVAAPRVHHQDLPDQFSPEEGALPPEVARELEARGHKIVPRKPIGGAYAIGWNEAAHAWQGVAEPRESGSAAGP